MLNSVALGDLKQMIDETSAFRRELASEITVGETELEQVRAKLRFAKTFILRLWTRKRVERLTLREWELASTLQRSKASLEASVVELGYDLSSAASRTQDALIDAFETMAGSQRIWAVRGMSSAGLAVLRTVASTAFDRSPVRFGYASPELIKSPVRPLQFPLSDERHLLIYPALLALEEDGREPTLLAFEDLVVRYAPLKFIEEEGVPADSVIIDRTWKRANKGGGPDKRYKDNYQIPICLYGELQFRTDLGLDERFIVSDSEKTTAFVEAFEAHQRAMSSMRGGLAGDGDLTAGPWSEEPSPPPAVPHKNLLLDWVGLLLIVWFAAQALTHANSLATLFAPPPPPVVQAPPQPAPAPPKSVKPHRRHKTAVAPAGSDSAPTTSAAEAPPSGAQAPHAEPAPSPSLPADLPPT